MTRTNPLDTISGWARGLGHALIRASVHLIVPPADWWLLRDMHEHDLRKFAVQHPKQRRYVLQRRRWAQATGRPIKMYPNSAGRVR